MKGKDPNVLQINIQQQKGIDEMVEKMMKDWMAIKEENRDFQNSLKSYGVYMSSQSEIFYNLKLMIESLNCFLSNN